MTRDDLIALALAGCGRRENDSWLQGIAVKELAIVQAEILERADFKPWFLLSEFLRTTTVAGEARVALPPAFLEEQEEGNLWIQPDAAADYTELSRDDPGILEARYGDTPSIPVKYSIIGNYFTLFPIPDKTYPLKVRVYLSEPALTYAYGSEAQQAVTTNKWITYAADWTKAELGQRLCSLYIKDANTAATFAQEAKDAKQRLYVQHVAREEMNRDRSQGDN